MKKLFVLVSALLLISAISAHSQSFRLNGYALYALDDNIDASNGIYYFNGTIKGGLLWGFGLEYNPIRDYGLELAYYRQDADFQANYYTGETFNETFKVGINYILLGGTRYLILRKSPVEPFGGLMLGMAIIENKTPKTGAPSSETKFAWEVKAGLNIMASKQFGIKLQAQLLSAVQSYGGGLFLGTGGASAGLGTYSSMLQVGFGGGIVLRFGK
jgi:hypothetical protein